LGPWLFSELQETGGVFATIQEPLASVFNDKNGGFEKAMAEFMDTRGVDAIRFQREMSCYFAKFSPGPDNLYRQIISVLKRTKRKAIFVTTNYEMLIELAAIEEGYKVIYQGDSVSSDSINVLKIHGSCNFLPKSEGVFDNVTFSGPPGGKTVFIEDDVRAVLPDKVLRFCREENSVCPALTLYAEGKRVLICRRFVEEQQEAWQIQAEKAKKIFVIGLKFYPRDTHIWDVLKSSSANLFHIGDENDFPKLADFVGRRRVHSLGNTFEQAIPKIKAHLLSN
jgi:hypothetical protein